MRNQYENKDAAQRYDCSVKIWEDGVKRVNAMKITSQMSVLDIGSGPGILAIPLAKAGCQVTAVEPSAAMRQLLQKHMEEEGITNIRILPYAWEELPEKSLESYDVIIASYSLMMNDFKEAVKKMNRHAKKIVELYWFAGETSWEKDRRVLEERLHRKNKKNIAPKIDCFYQSLYEMGIYSNITMLEHTKFDREYKNFEDAVSDMSVRYEIADSEEEVLREYLKERLEKRKNLWYYKDLTQYGKISWSMV